MVGVHENRVFSCLFRGWLIRSKGHVENVHVRTAKGGRPARKILNHLRVTESDRNKFKISRKALKIKIKLKIYTSVIMWFNEAV